jgi:hypothetical protein
MMIISLMKEYERTDMDNVVQSKIVNDMVRKLEIESNARLTSVDRSVETSKKVANVIQHLITKENILMVTQDAKIKNDRYLSLNINVEMNNAANILEGEGATTHATY